MAIRVEFFGIPRQRAGVASIELPATAAATLRDALSAVGRQFPSLRDCGESPLLPAAYAVNVGGQRFVRDLQTPLSEGQTVLLMSADAGG